jgi:probable metal-binding protein
MSSTSIHGHTLLNYVLKHGSVELVELRAWAARTLGADASFHTCAIQGLSFDGLMQFLLERGKLTLSGTHVCAHPEHICSDDEGHADKSTDV